MRHQGKDFNVPIIESNAILHKKQVQQISRRNQLKG